MIPTSEATKLGKRCRCGHFSSEHWADWDGIHSCEWDGCECKGFDVRGVTQAAGHVARTHDPLTGRCTRCGYSELDGHALNCCHYEYWRTHRTPTGDGSTEQP